MTFLEPEIHGDVARVRIYIEEEDRLGKTLRIDVENLTNPEEYSERIKEEIVELLQKDEEVREEIVEIIVEEAIEEVSYELSNSKPMQGAIAVSMLTLASIPAAIVFAGLGISQALSSLALGIPFFLASGFSLMVWNHFKDR